MAEYRYRTKVLPVEGMQAAWIEVPEEGMRALGAGRRPPVIVTIDGYRFPTTIAVMGGVVCVGINTQRRKESGLKIGQEADVLLELDTSERKVEVPEDLARFLASEGLEGGFRKLSYTQQKEHVQAIQAAKKPETRERRLINLAETIRAKMKAKDSSA